MGGPPGSQIAPLPDNLPFRLVSKTIGSGAYASIRKAAPWNASGPIIAVKFINKDHAFRAGRLRPKQLKLEFSLHQSVSGHHNVVKFLASGEDVAWVWMAMELAEGGDLFDKIEADEGVGEDIAHFYFTQLVSAVGWCHGKGVAHRDIKPENLLLSKEGDLKLADFGLATQFLAPRTGERKQCGMVCGSPPYIAPEILEVGKSNTKRKQAGAEKAGYDPETADVWSCAIVLFVLLAGNTPWDVPVLEESYEYNEYVSSHGRPHDPLWSKIPAAALSLVRGMLKVDVRDRFALDAVRKHLWFTRSNPHLSKEGKAANPVGLATQMMESLHIDFSAAIPASQQQRMVASPSTGMDVDSQPAQGWHQFAATQPETPVAETSFEWEAPPRLGAGVSASQPTTSHLHAGSLLTHLTQDISMSQFTCTPTIPLTLTQQARAFNDIVPSYSLARFISALSVAQLLPLLTSALHRLNIPVAAPSAAALDGRERVVSIRIKTLDARRQVLQGNVVVERIDVPGPSGTEVSEARFVKAKGDPLGWRRLFKQVAVLCKDAIMVPP